MGLLHFNSLSPFFVYPIAKRSNNCRPPISILIQGSGKLSRLQVEFVQTLELADLRNDPTLNVQIVKINDKWRLFHLLKTPHYLQGS